MDSLLRTKLRTRDGFKEVSKADFRQRFKPAFDLDPTLTETLNMNADDFWELLVAENFDARKAQLKVLKRIRNPDQFFIPVSLLNTPSPPPSFSSRALSSGTLTRSSSIPTLLSQANSLRQSASPRPKPSLKHRSPGWGGYSNDEINDEPRPTKRRKRDANGALGIRSSKPILDRIISECTEDEESDNDIGMGFFQDKDHAFLASSDNEEQSQLKPLPSRIKRPLRSLSPAGLEDDLQDFKFSDDDDNNEEDSLDGVENLQDEYDDVLEEEDVESWGWRSKNVSRQKQSSKSPANISKGVGRQNPDIAVKNHMFGTTKATPWLFHLAKPYYPDNLDEVSTGSKDLDLYPVDLERWEQEIRVKAKKEPSTAAFEDPVIWGNRKFGKTGYPSVDIDGLSYAPGDCVLVYPEDHDQQNLSSKKSKNTQQKPAPAWFARIVYLYEDEDGEPYAHFQWFEHGSTIMGALASPQELFVLSRCHDNPIGSIRGKIKVSYEPASNYAADNSYQSLVERKYKEGEYFYRQHYDQETNRVDDLPKDYSKSNGPRSGEQTCECCLRRTRMDLEAKSKLLGEVWEIGNRILFEGLYRAGYDYYVDDFVYIFKKPGQQYVIGQIKRIYVSRGKRYWLSAYQNKRIVNDAKIKIKVDIFERYDTFHADWFQEFNHRERKHAIRDERRLYLSGKTLKIAADRLDGKCIIRPGSYFADIEELDRFKDEEDRFWVKDQVSPHVDPNKKIQIADLIRLDTLNYSDRSEEEMKKNQERMDNFLRHGKKLRGLEIFGGIGGLSEGFRTTHAAEIEGAVEASPAACHTYRTHSPNCNVRCADASLLLDRVVRRENGEKLQPLLDNDRNIIPDLPHPGEVDFIIGGPPCPGYSSLNRFPKPSDTSNSLLVMYLGYVEFYRPKYFLLENVRGLLSHKLGAKKAVDSQKLVGGIESGTIKLIYRALTGMGYQVHHALLQAAEHNVPSTWKRVIFWASLPGFTLPEFPQPQNVHEHGLVGDVVTDLPAFEWVNPHIIIPQTPLQKKEAEQRWHTITAYDISLEDKFVGRNHQSYSTPPLSEFQRKLRKDVLINRLFNHITDKPGVDVERVCNIPMSPNKDHRDAPKDLMPRFLWHPDSKAAEHNFYPGRYGRLDMEGTFNTCLTSLEPCGPNAMVLHPTQHRVVTIREFARAMSIPDWFIFDLPKFRMEDAIRQIGNAVPCNLSLAVALPLRDVQIDRFEQEQRLMEQGPYDDLESSNGFRSKDSPTAETEDKSNKVSVPPAQSAGSQALGTGSTFVAMGNSLDDAIILDDTDDEDEFP
ncbi:hypothetical protein EG329_011334 [Mollisiaceae sp. DMI_Dod_QoI]|nr:hypothetical protein EG329_011334 [Helotiales sp. DMI_Dod_QoI]